MSNRFSSFLALAVFTLGIALLLLNITVWLRFHVQIPVHDIVTILPLVESGVTNGWWSISPQEWLNPISGNAHRIVVTRLLMLIDYTFLGGSNYAIYLSTWASIALLLMMYVKAAGLQHSEDAASRYFIAGISLIYLCSPTQYLNLINPVSASWYVAMASSAVSVWILISAGNRLNLGLLVLACFFAAAAAFSNFAGVLTCLIVPVVALHQRSGLSVLVVVFSAVFVFFYFHGVETNHLAVTRSQESEAITGAGAAAIGKLSSQLKSPELLLSLLSRMASSVSLHLGAPLSAQFPFIASLAVLGSALLIGFQWLLLGFRWCFQKEPAPRSVEFSLVMATICLGVSCAIPLGRAALNDPLAQRYQTITMVYWLSISCLIFFQAQSLDDKRQIRRALLLLAFIPALPIFGAFGFAMTPVVVMSNRANDTQVLGQMGINRFEGKEGWAELYSPYFADHKEFLSDFGLKPLTAIENDRQGVKVEKTVCDGFRLHESASRWPGVQEITLRLGDGSVNPFLTRLDLRGTNGELGRLYTHVPKKYELRSVFFGDRRWIGYYRGNAGNSMPITVFFDPVIGSRYQCDLKKK